MYFDLIGLPPSPEEVDAFLKDESPDAFAKVVDKLLASSHHGEKWARHWLDVARYAEDQAHTFGVKPKTQAWRYRDWVIAAFNADMPYDRFVKLQIAGDMLPDAPDDAFTKFAGLGFLGLGAEYYKNSREGPGRSPKNSTTASTRSRAASSALTVSCARCHDHKFDPIPTQRLLLARRHLRRHETERRPARASPRSEERTPTAQAKLKATEDKLKKAQADAKDKPDDKKPCRSGKGADAHEVAKLKKEMPPQPAVAHVVSGNGAGDEGLHSRQPRDEGRGRAEGLPASCCGSDEARWAAETRLARRDLAGTASRLG